MTKPNYFRRRSSAARGHDSRARRRLLIETLDPRMVLASLAGFVFEDANETWRHEADESALDQRLVFADANDNGLPDDGEAFALTNPDGSFALDDLGSDPQIIRLFQAAPSQVPHFPIRPEPDADAIPLGAAGAHGLELARLSGESAALLKAAGGAILVDLTDGSADQVELGGTPVTLAPLPDGRWLALANDSLGNRSFLIGPGNLVEPISLLDTASGSGDAHGGPADSSGGGWADVAVGEDGTGYLLPTSLAGEAVPLHRLDLTATPPAAPTQTLVPANARLIAGEGVTTVIAEPTDWGLDVSLWSNSTGTIISHQPVAILGGIQVLAYGEATALLYVLVSDDVNESEPAIRVLDVAAGFAPLQTIRGLIGLKAIDTDRGVIFAFDPSEGRLQAIDAVMAERIGEWTLPLTAEFGSDGLGGDFTEMSILPGGDALVLLGAGAVHRVAIGSVDAHRVAIDGSRPSYPLRFAATVDGENSPPAFAYPLQYSTFAGITLNLSDGSLTAGASDAEGDPFVVVRSSSPANGTVRITPHGGMTYTPRFGFVGTDSFEVFLHDGRGASAPQTVSIDVLANPNPPPAFEVGVRPIPQAVRPGFVAGQLESVGFLGPVTITVHDPRFEVFGDQILIHEGAVFEGYPGLTFETQITVTHAPTDYTLTTTLTMELSDEYATIDDIQPREASISESTSGEIVELTVFTTDLNTPLVLTVDDPRFDFVGGRTLRLKDGVQLSPGTLVLRITATEDRIGGQAMSVPFTLNVVGTPDIPEVPEAPQSIGLTNRSVTELIRGDEVGTVTVNGQSIAGRYAASVNDSRFEIIGGVLKLRDGDYLSRADQHEAQIVITVVDLDGYHPAYSEPFTITVRENSNPFHNPASPLDVNGDGEITPVDALLILNAISQNQGGGSIGQFPVTGYYWDVNGDGEITPLDALIILNFINQQQQRPPAFSSPDAVIPTPTESEGEADQLAPPLGVLPVPAIESDEDELKKRRR